MEDIVNKKKADNARVLGLDVIVVRGIGFGTVGKIERVVDCYHKYYAIFRGGKRSNKSRMFPIDDIALKSDMEEKEVKND